MTDWRKDAACRGKDPKLWFVEPTSYRSLPARQLCVACPSRGFCLAWAIEHDEVEGLWGGLSADERARGLVAREALDLVAIANTAKREQQRRRYRTDRDYRERKRASAREYARKRREAA